MSQISIFSFGLDKPDFDYLSRTESFVARNKHNIPFQGEISAQIISYNDLLFSPIPQLKCIQCGFYGRTYWCNPKLPRYYSWKDKFSKYNFFLLIKGKINVEDRYKQELEDYNIGEWRARFYSGNEGTNILMKRVKDRRMETSNYLSSFMKIRFLGEGGGCKKAVLPETRIRTILDEKKALDVSIGDVLYGYDIQQNNFTENRVINKIKTKSSYKIKITTESNKVLVLTPEHPVFINNKWKRADAVFVGDELLVLSNE